MGASCSCEPVFSAAEPTFLGCEAVFAAVEPSFLGGELALAAAELELPDGVSGIVVILATVGYTG